MSAGCGYTLALMNDAIKPSPETLSQAGLPELSVVVPTFNERDNVTVLYRRLEATLSGISWEVVFVDDNSPDGTWEVVRGLARKDSRVRCVRRIGRRGLSGACIEGILASIGPYAAVIDADLQHDETQLPKMVALLRTGEAELVVGSRYVEGGSADSFNKQRAGASQLATEVARRVLKVEVADPMSGFFMICRDQQLHPEQFSHLSRPAAEGICDPARPVAVLSRLRGRTARQCRRRVRGLRSGTDLVARGRRRRADGRGLELRDVRTVRLAQA